MLKLNDKEQPFLKRNSVFICLYIFVLVAITPFIVWLAGGQKSMPDITASLGGIFGSPLGGGLQPEASGRARPQMSLGDRILITLDNTPSKQMAARAFAVGNYATAIESLKLSLKTKPNDPEGMIYLSNAEAAAAGDPLKIGVSVPIGRNLDVAKEILRGVAQAQNEINATGGIGGKLVQVEIADDRNDPEISQQVASEFVQNSKLLAVIGHNASKASLVTAPIYEKGNLVAISPTSMAMDLSSAGSSTFRTVPNARTTADELARYSIQVDRRARAAICADSQDEASSSFKEEFTWSFLNYGGTISSVNCDFSDPKLEPTEIPSKAITDGSDVLLLSPSPYTEDVAIDVAIANGKQLSLIGSQLAYTYDFLRRGQQEVNGMVLSVAWHPDELPKNPFVSGAKKLWGAEVGWRSATSYDATKAILEGLKLYPSREQLATVLKNPGFAVDGATGKVQFLSTGDRSTRGILVKVQPGTRSGAGYQFAMFQPLSRTTIAAIQKRQ